MLCILLLHIMRHMIVILHFALRHDNHVFRGQRFKCDLQSSSNRLAGIGGAPQRLSPAALLIIIMRPSHRCRGHASAAVTQCVAYCTSGMRPARWRRAIFRCQRTRVVSTPQRLQKEKRPARWWREIIRLPVTCKNDPFRELESLSSCPMHAKPM